MHKETLYKAAILHDRIKDLEKQRKFFDQTKEFCNITMTGEDGAERPFTIKYSHTNRPELIEAIRDTIYNYFALQGDLLNKEIEEL